MRSSSRFFVLFAVLALAGCRTHVQSEGPYRLIIDALQKEECGLFQVGTDLGLGEWTATGDIVQVRLELYRMVLAGAYEANAERFYLDGSVANFTLPVTNGECVFDRVAMHLDGETQTADSFTAKIQVEYQTEKDCECEVWGILSGQRE